MTKKMLHQSIHRHSQTGNEIHLLSIITLSNFFRHNTIYKNEHCSIKLTTHYSITADLQYCPQQQMSVNACPFGLCYCVKYSCNISLIQNTTKVVYPVRTTVTNREYCC